MSNDSAQRGSDGGRLVSVIVPAFNAEATLADTLESIAAQTYRNIEIIVVDDGSTDGTAAIGEEFCAKESRARLIRKENGGVASARNRGIAEAKGAWVAPIDADDLWHPTKIEKQLAAASAAPHQPGFVYCWRRLICRDGLVVASGLRFAFEGSAFIRLAYVNAVECGSSLLLSRDAALAVGGYDESLRARHAQGCEDMLLQLQVARRWPIAVVPEHLVGWRLHDQNMSSDFDQMARSCSLVFETLAAQGTPVPQRIIRNAMSRIYFELAEQRAANGRYSAMLSCLARAIALDPARSSAALCYRLARAAFRRLRRPSAERTLPRFEEVDPAAVLSRGAEELPAFSRLLQRHEEERLSLLKVEEPPLGDKFPSKSAAAVG